MNKKEFIVILIFTLLVIIVWAVGDTIRTPASESVDPKLKKALEPLNGTFDQSVTSKLEQSDFIKVAITPSQTVPAPISSPIPKQSPPASASPSGQIIATPSANTP